MARNLLDAIFAGDEQLARDILVRGTYGNIDGRLPQRPGTALFCCCIRGYLPLVILLLEHGADVESRNESQATPLHGAVDNGHLEIVRVLLDRQADVNAQTQRGDTPLHLAAYRGFPLIAQCLVQAGADLTLRNSNRMTPEMDAEGQGHSLLAHYLRAVRDVLFPGVKSESGYQHIDSLIYLDPPSLVAVPDRWRQGNQLQLLQEKQQTHLQQGPTSPLQLPVRPPPLGAPAEEKRIDSCGPQALDKAEVEKDLHSDQLKKNPLREQKINVFDYERYYHRPSVDSGKDFPSCVSNCEGRRQPQQTDENDEYCSLVYVQEQQQQQTQQPIVLLRQEQQQCIPHNQSQSQFQSGNSLLLNHNASQQLFPHHHHHHKHQEQHQHIKPNQRTGPHPTDPLSFIQFEPVITPNSPQTLSSFSTTPTTPPTHSADLRPIFTSAAGLDTLKSNSLDSLSPHFPTLFSLDSPQNKHRLSTPEANDRSLRLTEEPELNIPKNASRRRLSVGFTGSGISDASSGGINDVTCAGFSCAAGVDASGTVLYEEADDVQREWKQNNISSWTPGLTRAAQSAILSEKPLPSVASRRVLRSQSVNFPPGSAGGKRRPGATEVMRTADFWSKDSVGRREALLCDFVPTGPPPLPAVLDSDRRPVQTVVSRFDREVAPMSGMAFVQPDTFDRRPAASAAVCPPVIAVELSALRSFIAPSLSLIEAKLAADVRNMDECGCARLQAGGSNCRRFGDTNVSGGNSSGGSSCGSCSDSSGVRSNCRECDSSIVGGCGNSRSNKSSSCTSGCSGGSNSNSSSCACSCITNTTGSSKSDAGATSRETSLGGRSVSDDAYGSDYGSEGTSLLSVASDACSTNISYTSDSGTDFNSDTDGSNTRRQQQRTSPYATGKVSDASCLHHQTLSVPASPAQPKPCLARYNSMPDYNNTIGGFPFNNLNKKSNRDASTTTTPTTTRTPLTTTKTPCCPFARLNDLSAGTGTHVIQGPVATDPPLFTSSHGSMPTLTCVNIPIN